MSLDQTKILANTKKYFETATKIGFMNDELMALLGEDFIKAPASSMADYHNAFEGGLIDHLLRVASYAVKINNTLPEDERVDQNSLLKVCLLHGIGKAKLYKPCTSEWHRKNQGKMYEFNDDLVSMRVGERSAYYILSHGISLTEEEFAAILFFDKVDDRMSDYHNSMVGELLKMGNVLAIKHSQKHHTHE
jgi:hypothetical protein